MWQRLLDLLKLLVWALVALSGLYWVGKPLAEGASHWMTRASPDKFLEVLFGFPTVLIVAFLIVGPGRIRGYIDSLMKRGFKAGSVEVPPDQSAGDLSFPKPTPKAEEPLMPEQPR